MAIQFFPAPHGVTWSHFREVAASPDGNDAQTGYTIAAGFHVDGSAGAYRATRIAATVRLDAGDSWVVRGSKTAALLAHEKLHYVIATLIGRELDTELAAVTGDDIASVQATARQLISDKNDRAYAIGTAYDDDTNHGTVAAEQQRWLVQVQGWEHAGNRVTWP